MIIPSVDLSRGKAVQLKQGREKALELDNPVEIAHSLSRFGEIAVIDLDAAMQKGGNKALIKELCGQNDCRVGGGIRTVDKAREIVSYGAHKIIVGTAAFKDDGVDHRFLKELTSAVGRERIIIAVDAYNGAIVTEGWTERTPFRVADVIPDLQQYASELLFTCVEKEGLMGGSDTDAIEEIVSLSSIPVVVAGGVSTVEEIERISALNAHIQLGMALYTGKLSAADAFIASLDWSKGLLPTITTDTSMQVLMLAYSSVDSLRRLFETEYAWYYSRSRNRLWMKGETSRQVQKFVKIRTDCDRDALLLTVEPAGPSCHLGHYSCFGDKRFSLEELYAVIEGRLKDGAAGSYTATLTPGRLKAKIMEEAQELTEAESAEEVIWEAADLLYFLTVRLAREGIQLEQVLNELRRRRRSSR